MRLIVLLILLLYASVLNAAPFLVCCDGTSPEYPAGGLQPDSFSLSFDGKPAVGAVAILLPSGAKILKYDLALAGLLPGEHSVKVIAVKAASGSATGGTSAAVNFSFGVGPPAAPLNVHVSPN